ncbi:MAG TPA: hypothetical protein VG101_15500 [Puia sp.]|jgi:antitoxin component YwqK of YwqJK toxin-antitoxin module|nr:hypothetical protein [Puia sp.]
MFRLTRSLTLSIATVPLILGLLVACHHGKVRIVLDEYAKNKPKTVYYFDNEEDAGQHPVVIVKNGISHANKPLSFDIERYYSNGKLYCKGQYIKGQTCGLWQYFYSSGILQAKCYYWNGIPRDTAYCWYPSGKLRRFLVEVDTTKRQWHGTDYYENGEKLTECYLTADSLGDLAIEGDYKAWYPNGNPRMQATAKSDWSIGKWRRWDSAGTLEEGDSTIGLTY